MRAISFARRLFFWAAIYGIAVLAPQYLLEGELGRQYPPPVTHPELYYGFVGVALAWQLAFLVISRDVVKYRLLMLPAAVEKLVFPGAVYPLWAAGRAAPPSVFFASIDLVLGVLFVVAWRAVGRAQDRAAGG